MSFITFDMGMAAIARAAASEPATTTDATAFSSLEWSVIHASDRDDRTSLDEPGRLRRSLQRLFGFPRKTRLANPRLEALRRMNVLLRSRDGASPIDHEGFRAAGFTDHHLALLEARRLGG